MNLTTKLIELLRQYIDEYNKLKEVYKQGRTVQTLYEELIKTLTEHNPEENKTIIIILLNTIYGNNIYIDEFYRILLQNNQEEQIKQFITKITKEYSILKKENYKLKERINRNQNMISSAHRVIASLKYQTRISKSKNDIVNIKRIINYYEISGVISNKEELLLINEIELHNRKVASKYGNIEEKDYTDNLYNEIPTILTIGFQEHDTIEISPDRKNTVDKFVKEILNLITYIEKDEILKTIEEYKKYNLNNNEYNYIIVKLLDTYLDELMTLYELLIEKEVYTHRAERMEVIKNYYLTLEKYIILRNYYNQLTEYVIEDEKIEQEHTDESTKEKRLIYSHSEINITKTRFVSDMSDIPYEYYDDIYNLLIKFKNGNISDKMIKSISNGNNGDKNDGYKELKDDSIRIIIKHIKDNIYSIVGVFTKKANNNNSMYRKIMNRMIPDVSTEEKLSMQLELSKRTEEELIKLVREKARKNGRK